MIWEEIVPLNRGPKALAELGVAGSIAIADGLAQPSIQAIERVVRPAVLARQLFDGFAQDLGAAVQGVGVVFLQMATEIPRQCNAKPPWLLVQRAHLLALVHNIAWQVQRCKQLAIGIGAGLDDSTAWVLR